MKNRILKIKQWYLKNRTEVSCQTAWFLMVVAGPQWIGFNEMMEVKLVWMMFVWLPLIFACGYIFQKGVKLQRALDREKEELYKQVEYEIATHRLVHDPSQRI